MTVDDLYVLAVASKYRVSTGPNSPAHWARSLLLPIIKEWAGKYLSGVAPSGSYAKGTAVRGSTDIDLFISLVPSTPSTLKDIYQNLFRFLNRKGFSPTRRNVSVGIQFGGLAVDLVPAKRQPGSTTYHSLYRRRADTWTQTSIFRHIGVVRNSRRILEIQAVKIWRQLHGLDFPSFYLELTTIDALRGRPAGQPAPNLLVALGYIAHRFPTARVVDPANTNNAISDDLTASEKKLLAAQAAVSLWKPLHQIIW